MSVNRSFPAFVALLGFIVSSGHARAATIIDTGDTGNPSQFGWVLGDYTINGQRLAAQFTLTDKYTVTAVETWLVKYTFPVTITAVIYGDRGEGIPDKIQLLYSKDFLADSPRSVTANRTGPQGLNRDLGPGPYWLAFEVRGSDSLMFTAPDSVPAPLNAYATYRVSTGKWSPMSDASKGFGIRIHGDLRQTAVVPEPATLTLLGLGPSGLAVRRLHRRR